jgi:hypothetical protein
MKMRIAGVITVCALMAGLATLAVPAAQAQNQSSAMQPSADTYISNVAIKPGGWGAYMKAEAAEAQAQRAAQARDYYFGMESITGADRVLYVAGYSSFAEAQKIHEETMGNSTLKQAIENAGAEAGPEELSHQGSFYQYRKDLSLNPDVDFPSMRFMDLTVFEVREGHEQDFERTVKLYLSAYEKAVPDAHWAIFQKMFGEGSGDTFLLATPIRSLADEDAMMGNGKKLRASVGDALMETMMQLGSSTIKSSESDLFVLDPSISYVPASWETDSPGFWNK